MNYTFINNRSEKKFFASTNHMQGHALGESWVPVSGSLPMYVSPRPSLPTGFVNTIEDYIMIFHDGDEWIPNPSTSFEPSWSKYSTTSKDWFWRYEWLKLKQVLKLYQNSR